MAGENTISVFQLNGHEAPTRLTQFQTDAAVDELRFTANHAAIYYRQADGKIAVAAIHE